MSKTPGDLNPEFFSAMAKKLQSVKGIDIELSEILITHLLKDNPDSSATDNALNATVKLARSRATSKGKDAADG